jgi:hypothetical protein
MARRKRRPEPSIEIGKVEMTVEGRALVNRPVDEPRAGWAEAFRQMATRGDDVLLDPEATTCWDEEEWEWR